MSGQVKSLVFRGGTVVDGTGTPPRKVDVRCEGGRVTAVGNGLKADEAVDCGGLFLTPGFIDTHSHSDLKSSRIRSCR